MQRQSEGPGILVLMAVGCVLVIVAAAFFLLSDSGQPQSETLMDGSSEEPEPGASGSAKPASAASGEDPGSDQQLEEVLFAPWGDGAGELGRRTPEEGAPEGPMSFLVGPDGRVYVLDQVNRRVQIFKDGKVVREVKIPGDTFQDLALDPEGRVVLLDRLVDKAVVFLDPERRVALEGIGVPEGGGVTGMFVQEDGVWVEVEHQRLVRIADASGKADPERPVVPGRFSADGAWLLLAAKEGKNAAVVSRRPVGEAEAPFKMIARVEFGMRVLRLTALLSDPAGEICLGAHLARLREVAPFDVLEESEVLVIISQDGAELGRVGLPVTRLALEQFRSIRMGADGALYHLYCTNRGAALMRIVW